MIKTSSFIALLMFFMQTVTAQFVFKPEYIYVSQTVPNGNTVVLKALNPLPGMHFYHHNTEYQVGDTIYNYGMVDSIICEYFQDVLVTVMGPDQDFDLDLFQSTSNMNSGDGEIIMHFNNRQVFTGGHFDINFPIPNAAFGLPPVSSDSTIFHFTQVIASAFTINGDAHAIDVGVGSARFLIAGILFDQDMHFMSQQGLKLKVSLSDVSTNCDGIAEVTPVNNVGSVTYQWDNDPAQNSNIVSGLCPGVHYVSGIESATQHSASRQFIITDITQNYYDSTNMTLAATDTIHLNYMNCELEYISPIDSIQLEFQYQTEVNNEFFYEFNLLIFQYPDTFSITGIVSTTSPSSVILFDIAIYCEELKSADFKGKRITSAKDFSTLGLTPENQEKFSFYPNPAKDYLNFSNGLYSGEIFDLNGRKIRSFDEQDKVFVSDLEQGVYLIQLSGQSKVMRFVKQ